MIYATNVILQLKVSNKGSALINLGKYNEAIVEFVKALKINPNDIDALSNKGK